MNISDLLAEIDKCLAHADEWRDVTDEKLAREGGEARASATSGWTLLIVRWPGGVDGTATRFEDGVIVRLPPETAQRAAEKAWP